METYWVNCGLRLVILVHKVRKWRKKVQRESDETVQQESGERVGRQNEESKYEEV